MFLYSSIFSFRIFLKKIASISFNFITDGEYVLSQVVVKLHVNISGSRGTEKLVAAVSIAIVSNSKMF